MLVLLGAVGLPAVLLVSSAAPVSSPLWNTVFRDDFEGAAGTGVSPTAWLYATGTGYPGGAPRWGTGEVEVMTDSVENVFHDGAGHLAIRPLRDERGAWTSGRIETQRTDFAAPAGGLLRVEASMRQPDVTGAAAAGYWPAFWMLGDAARPVGATNWPAIGEIDIAEDINGRGAHFAALHCGIDPGGPCNERVGISSGELACPTCQTSYHTYAVEYDRSITPEQLRWYRDGNPVFTVEATQVDPDTWTRALHHGFFIIFDVAIGGDFPAAFGGGPTPDTVPGAPLVIDYVAVHTSTGPSPPSPSPSASGGRRDAYASIEAEAFDDQAGTRTELCADVGAGWNITAVNDGDWLRFDGVDFGAVPATQFRARVASGASGGVSGVIEVHLDDRSTAAIGSFAIGDTGGWQSWRTVPANISAVTGIHTLYLTFASGQLADFVNINWFTFGH